MQTGFGSVRPDHAASTVGSGWRGVVQVKFHFDYDSNSIRQDEWAVKDEIKKAVETIVRERITEAQCARVDVAEAVRI